MDVQMRRDLLVDLSQKAQEFLMAVLAVAFADDFARGDIQGGKERGGAVAIVVVGSALGLSGFHRQNRLAAFQSLHLTFLIHAKHNGMGLFRWVEVKAHDVAHLFHKEGIAGELEVLFPVRLEAEALPDAFDGVMGKPDFPSHQPGAPLSGRFGLLFQSLCNHRFHLAVGDSSGRAAAGSVSQALDALSDITRSPFAHRWRADSQGGCHLPVIHTLRARQDDARTLSRPLAGLRAPGDQFQLLSIFLLQS